MNLFVLDIDPITCARAHYDRHLGKMALEAAQMLSTAHWERDDGSFRHFGDIYLPTHENHPCNVWVRERGSNYLWTHMLATALADEWQHRFGWEHAVVDVLRYLSYAPACLEATVGLPRNFALAIPSYYADRRAPPDEAVALYRRYYAVEKAHLRYYTDREEPTWLREIEDSASA